MVSRFIGTLAYLRPSVCVSVFVCLFVPDIIWEPQQLIRPGSLQDCSDLPLGWPQH